jgi:hypothetical protein
VVRDAEEDNVTVTILLDEVEGGIAVDAIERHPTADVAVLRIGHWIDIFDSFRDVARTPNLGAEVTAFGYPEDTGTNGPLPTPRFFRGHVQRRFHHQSHSRYSYDAAELSFGAPGGLSGGPVAGKRSPGLVTAVVAENKKSTTYLETITDVHDGSVHYREEVHSVINYGICVLLDPLREWLDDVVPRVH